VAFACLIMLMHLEAMPAGTGRGVLPKRVQVLLGHSSIQMTFDVYGHLFPSLEDEHAKFAAVELAVVG
jgi:integrase